MMDKIHQLEIDRIDALCLEYDIVNYVINEDLTIDVDSYVDLRTFGSNASLPLSFGKVSGNFFCNYNNLSTLDGCPTTVGGSFICSDNHLTTLEHCPISVGGDFICSNNRLISLDGCPTYVGGTFDCSNNLLTSLEHCPITVGDYIEYDHNNTLATLVYFPKEFGEVVITKGTPSLDIFNSLLQEYFPNGDIYSDNPYDDYYGKQPEEVTILFKYMNYYDVWLPEFNRDNMMLLIADIKDGLK